MAQGKATRHSNVHVDLSCSSSYEDVPSDVQESETGSCDLGDLEENNAKETFVPVVEDPKPGSGVAVDTAKGPPSAAAGYYYEEDDETVEFFTTTSQPDIGVNKRDVGGSLMGRKLDCSASSYKQTLTLSNGNKVSCNLGDENGKTLKRKSHHP